ncbi:uncharacterized protein [Battus philenor]|uniref:uncharacterized protein n=1 Tax=Battus philenor TaxID=42288 RepID=UPI0035CF5568
MSLIEENWNYEVDILHIENSYFVNFKSVITNYFESALKTLENSVWADNYRNLNGQKPSNDDDLTNLMEKNKTLRQEIDLKVKNVQKQQNRYSTIKQDQKLLSQEIKEKHEAFLMAKKYYKKFLRIYFTIESKNEDNQTIFVQFFTEAKKDSECYSIRLLRHSKTAKYQLLSTNPNINFVKEIQKKLNKNNDLPGALCCIKQIFEAMKTSIHMKY